MVVKTVEIPYSQQTADLCRLAGKRAQDSVLSVMQLGDDPREDFAIALAAVCAVAGMWAGAFDNLAGQPEGTTDEETAFRLLSEIVAKSSSAELFR